MLHQEVSIHRFGELHGQPRGRPAGSQAHPAARSAQPISVDGSRRGLLGRGGEQSALRSGVGGKQADGQDREELHGR
jgi:hypothetical protein